MPQPRMTPGGRQTPMEAEPRQHPNCAAAARHEERLLAPWRDAEWRPAKRIGKRTDQADTVLASMPQQDGVTHAEQVKALMRDRALTNWASVARLHQRDAERTWLDAYW